MVDLIEDPGPIIDPGKGGGQPVLILPDVFHKQEIVSVEDIDPNDAKGAHTMQLLAALEDSEIEGKVSLTELLLPAVQADSFTFLKVEWSSENVGELESLSEEGAFDGIDGSVLLPAVQADGDFSDKSSPLLIKITDIEGESTPEQSAWQPLDDLG